MKQHVAPIIVFVANQKVVHVRLKLTTLVLSARMQYLFKKKSCLCEARTHDLHITARHCMTLFHTDKL